MKLMVRWYHKPVKKGGIIGITYSAEEGLHPLGYADGKGVQKKGRLSRPLQ